jgi:dCTP deaminase
MVLSDRDIREMLEHGMLKVEPLEDLERQLQPCSIDLRLGSQFTFYRQRDLACSPGRTHPPLRIGIDDPSEMMVTDEFSENLLTSLYPGEFILASTIESVTLPDFILGRVDGRSSIARLGICCHITAGFIDPGFSGQITLEMFNFSPVPIYLTPGMRICQISFELLSTPADRPYGAARGSKYIGQRGPTPSRIQQDFSETVT